MPDTGSYCDVFARDYIERCAGMELGLSVSSSAAICSLEEQRFGRALGMIWETLSRDGTHSSDQLTIGLAGVQSLTPTNFQCLEPSLM